MGAPSSDCIEPFFVLVSDTAFSRRRRKVDAPLEAFCESIDAFFSISKRGSTVSREICAGFVTWVTMSYIVVVNPTILSAPGDGLPIPFHVACRATCLSAAIASSFVGFLGNLPFGLAAGMGLNSYVRYGVIGRLGLSPSAAMACCCTQAVLFAVLAASGVVDLLQAALPSSLKSAITVAIGMFQAFVGFQLMGLVVRSESTYVALGDVTQPTLWLALAATLLATALLVRRAKGALLVSIVFVTGASNLIRLPKANNLIGDMPSSGAGANFWLDLDFGAALTNLQEYVTVVVCMLFIVVFDTTGVQHGIGQQAGLLDESGRLPGARWAYLGSSLGTGLGAFLGTSPVIIHNESAAGVQEGGRTGLCAVTTALLFLVSPALVPLIELIPPEATAPCLVIVGAMMMVPVRDKDFIDLRVALPAFLIICVTPMTFSISAGIFSGIAAHFVLKLVLWLVEAAQQVGQAAGSMLLLSALGSNSGAPEGAAVARPY